MTGGGGGHAVRGQHPDIHSLGAAHVGQRHGDGSFLILAGCAVHLRRTGQNVHLLADRQHDVLRRLTGHRLGGLIGQVDAQHGGANLRVLLGHDLVFQDRRAARLDGIGIGGIRAAYAQRQTGGIGEYQAGDDFLGRVIFGIVDQGQAQLRLLACHQAGYLGIVHIQLIALHHHRHGGGVIAVDHGKLRGEGALRRGAVLEIVGLEFNGLVAGGGKGRHREGVVQILHLAAGPVVEILA